MKINLDFGLLKQLFFEKKYKFDINHFLFLSFIVILREI